MNNMTITNLIELLQDAATEFGGDAPVRFAIQPNYPLAQRFAAITTADQLTGDELEENQTVWIALSDDHDDPYGASRSAWDGRRA